MTYHVPHIVRALLVRLTFCLAFTVTWLPAPPAQAADPGLAPDLLAQRKGNDRKSKRSRRRKERRKKAKQEQAEARAAETEQAAEAPQGAQAGGEGNVETEGAAPQPSAGSLRRSNRMEFDARLIRGQTAGSGAVVLFDRGQRELPALTKARTRFLDATVREVYDDPPAGASGR